MKKRIVLVMLAAVAIGAIAWFVRARSAERGATPSSAGGAPSDRVVPVVTTRVERRDVPIWLEGLGNVAAFYTVTVKTQVDGRIDKVFFAEGQRVKKGEVLVQIDPRPFLVQLEQGQAALARDAANADNAKLNLERYKKLRADNLIPEQQVTDQQAMVAQLEATMHADQAQIDNAKLMLDYARVTSPINGVTGVRLVDPGNVVHASDQTGLVVVTQLDPIAVFFTLPQDDLPSISEARAAGKPLAVEAISRDGGKLLGEGALSVIDNQINQATATIRLKAIFPNPNQSLWPNQFVKARLRLATRSNALVIPTAVVQHGPEGMFAYVVDAGDTVSARPVQIASMQGELAIVDKGLAVGDVVVLEGQAQLRPGSHVAAKPAGSNAQSNAEAKP
jgi:multidrug efflux system membrane fusion protein